jgi:hypothetical protein
MSGQFDLDDVSAEPGQRFSAGWPCLDLGEVDDADSPEGGAFHLPISSGTDDPTVSCFGFFVRHWLR